MTYLPRAISAIILAAIATLMCTVVHAQTPTPQLPNQSNQAGGFGALLASMSNDSLRDASGEPIGMVLDIFTPTNAPPVVLINPNIRSENAVQPYIAIPIWLLQQKGTTWFLVMTAAQLQATPKQPVTLAAGVSSARLGQAPTGLPILLLSGSGFSSGAPPGGADDLVKNPAGPIVSPNFLNPHERAQQTIDKLWGSK